MGRDQEELEQVTSTWNQLTEETSSTTSFQKSPK